MSITRMAVFIGIMCSVWMTSPSTADAFEKFVGQADRGSTKVKNCVDGKGGSESFANSTALKVELDLDLADGDGLGGDDNFVAAFSYDGQTAEPPLFRGIWSKIDERNGTETYQLTPSGDLAVLAESAAISSDDISVPSTAAWVDSGIAIASGDTLMISATGSCSPNGTTNFNGPDGDGAACITCVAPGPTSRYALVGRIGAAGTPFLIGSSFSETIFESGSLFLAFNDDIFGDNGGSFLASVDVSTSIGWDDLLTFMNEEAGDACQTAPPSVDFPALSELLKGTLVVKKTLDDTNARKCDASCQAVCGGSNCREAEVRLDVKAFMKDSDVGGVSPKTDWVKFKYKAKGYVVLNP
jgi:hypothetical protein